MSNKTVTTTMTTASDTQWLTIASAAEYLGFSVKTIRRRISEGSLEARRFGPRLIRVSSASLYAMGDPVVWRQKDE